MLELAIVVGTLCTSFWWIQVDDRGHPATIIAGKNKIMTIRQHSVYFLAVVFAR